MSNLRACLNDAQQAIAKQATPSFSKTDYENALIELAAAEKHDGETEEAALDRLVRERDSRARALSKAAYAAETLMLQKRHNAAFRSPLRHRS